MWISEVKRGEERAEVSDYCTWYEFKKDLEKRAGRRLLNGDWLQVKPEAPLPWNESHLRSALLRLRRSSDKKLDHWPLVSAN